MVPAKIVVVNDDAAYIEMVSELLADTGYRTSSCTGSREAYRLVKHERPDLVLLDVHMESPDSGMNVLALLRLDRETADLPVIVCSADATFLRQKRVRLQEYGCEILEKPFRIEDLEELIVSLVNAPAQELEREV